MADIEDAPTVTLAGKTYPIPPIPFRVAKKIVPKIIAHPNVGTEEGMDEVLGIIVAGIQCGTPDAGEVESFLDGHYTLEELLAAFAIVSSQAGLKAKSPGEAKGT